MDGQAATLIALVALGLVVFEGWLVLQLLRQNGRLLVRLDTLEERLAGGGVAAAPPPPQTAGLPIGTAAPPFTLLDVASQAGLERQLRTDPVARAAVAMLEAAAVTALVLALLGLLLGVVAERSDDRAELFDLEAQGLAPAQLRRQLRLRALVAAASGALGGVLIGLVLSALVVGFVELTANATAPEPPLVLSLDWAVVGTAAAAVTAAAILLVVAVTGRAFRHATPGRYGEGGA